MNTACMLTNVIGQSSFIRPTDVPSASQLSHYLFPLLLHYILSAAAPGHAVQGIETLPFGVRSGYPVQLSPDIS